MVKPKNKHSLSHVRHDPAHCLAPGLFRALKPVTEFAAGKYDITRPKAAGATPPPHSIVNKTFLSFIFNGLFSC